MELFKSISNKILLFLLINILFASLLLFAVAKPLLYRSTVKGWLAESTIYDQLVEGFLTGIDEETKDTNAEVDAQAFEITQSTTGPVSQAELVSAVQDVITADYLQSQAETAIDGFYDVAEGETESPDFTIGLTAKKDELIDRFNLLLKENIAALPPCGINDQIPTADTSPLDFTCVPGGVNTDTFIDMYTEELRTNPEFLGEAEISGDELFTDTDSPQKVNRAANTILVVVPVLTVLFAIGVVFTSKKVLRGARSVAITASLAGLAGFVLFWILDRSSQFVIDKAITENDFGSLQDFAETSVASLYNAAVSDIAYTGLVYSSVMLILGAVVAAGLYLYERRNQPEEEGTKVNDEEKIKADTKDKSSEEEPEAVDSKKPSKDEGKE